MISLILRFVNGYTTFLQAFGWGFLLWTIVNLYDAIVLDIIWFCHDPYFVFKGTEKTQGQRIKAARIRKGYTQEQLAEVMHIPKSTVSAYENDKVDIKGRSLL